MKQDKQLKELKAIKRQLRVLSNGIGLLIDTFVGSGEESGEIPKHMEKRIKNPIPEYIK